MRAPFKFFAGLLLGVGLFLPFQALAVGFSFGGRILTVIPCVSGFGPSLWVSIKPAGVFAPTYIWTPATVTRLVGPPRNIGQQVLGVADVPFVCVIPAKIPIPLYGLRMQIVGTSLF